MFPLSFTQKIIIAVLHFCALRGFFYLRLSEKLLLLLKIVCKTEDLRLLKDLKHPYKADAFRHYLVLMSFLTAEQMN